MYLFQGSTVRGEVCSLGPSPSGNPNSKYPPNFNPTSITVKFGGGNFTPGAPVTASYDPGNSVGFRASGYGTPAQAPGGCSTENNLNCKLMCCCKSCPVGQYNSGCTLNNAGTVDNVGTCKPCKTCPAGQYSSGCTLNNAGTCKPCKTCPVGQWNNGCRVNSPGYCDNCNADCPSGQYRHGCGGRSIGQCKPCKSCPSGQWQEGCGGGYSNGAWFKVTNPGKCIVCKSCPAGTYLSGCGGKYPGECRKCWDCPDVFTNNEKRSQYRIGCGGNNAGQCTVCKTCPQGQYNSGCKGINAGQCTVCKTCPVGTWRGQCGGRNHGTNPGECFAD